MRISDWSSDVCSSDLPLLQQERVVGDDMKCGIRRRVRISAGGGHQIATFLGKELMPAVQIPGIEQLGFEKQELLDARSGWTIPGSHAASTAARRVGKECVSTCRSRGLP